jgi:intracellular septation protein
MLDEADDGHALSLVEGVWVIILPMKFLFDLFPVILFFAAFKLADIYVATAAAIAATFLQIGVLALLKRRIEPMLWVSLAIIVVFGGATLALRDETFIKWKPTVLYWLFGAALAGSSLLFRRNLMRAMLSTQVQLPESVWARLNWSWTGFFAFMGAANLLVAFNFSTDQWVNFKLFGATGLMLLFVIGQALYLARHLQEDGAQEGKP